MVRTMVKRVMWVGRATVFMIGLSVIMAVVLGAATTALGATGQSFILGRTNTAETPTALVGTLADAAKSALIVTNKSGGPALELRVGNATTPANTVAPMKVNSNKVVTNLNADKLDNLHSSALMRASTYEAQTIVSDNSTDPTNQTFGLAKCDVGDKVLSGGFSGLDPNEGTLTQTTPVEKTDADGTKEGWQVLWKNGTEAESGVIVTALCADFPPAHTP